MFRIGLGYDSHRFVPGRPLILGGVFIDFPFGMGAHSDGDVILHALTDAILGAIGQGDIGELFPDTDPQWKDAHSAIFVNKALQLAKNEGYVVGNCDITLLAQSPKMSPHKQAITETIAELLHLPPRQVCIKAKTNEGMGYIGRNEGIACYCIVLLNQTSER